MTNISRYHAPEDPLDDLFRGFFLRPMRFDGPQEAQIKLDVSEDEKGYTVHAEIPGAKKEDIHVAVDGSLVSLAAEVRHEREVKEGSKSLRSERYFGRISRSFNLGQEIDEASVSAKYADGVLTVCLPKRTTTAARRIAVQ